MKTYFITGANRGLGKEAVRQLLQSPENRVIATCRTIEGFPELPTKNPNLVILRLDYNDEESLINVSKELAKLQWCIDVFIANAALNNAKHGVLESSSEEYQRFFKVNAIGPIETLRIIKPYMMQSSVRKVIFKSSILGSINDFPIHLAEAYPCAPYSVSKAALQMMCKILSYELQKDNFIVICYHPGMINTKHKESNDDVSARSDFIPNEEFITKISMDTLGLEDGVSRELQIIDKLTIEDSGKFITHTGKQIHF